MYHRLECGFKVTCPNVYYMKMEITENWSLSLENTAYYFHCGFETTESSQCILSCYGP